MEASHYPRRRKKRKKLPRCEDFNAVGHANNHETGTSPACNVRLRTRMLYPLYLRACLACLPATFRWTYNLCNLMCSGIIPCLEIMDGRSIHDDPRNELASTCGRLLLKASGMAYFSAHPATLYFFYNRHLYSEQRQRRRLRAFEHDMCTVNQRRPFQYQYNLPAVTHARGYIGRHPWHQVTRVTEGGWHKHPRHRFSSVVTAIVL